MCVSNNPIEQCEFEKSLVELPAYAYGYCANHNYDSASVSAENSEQSVKTGTNMLYYFLHKLDNYTVLKLSI